MIHRKQTGFDNFHCIADKCPKSCCEGWQIVIDEDSLQKYHSYSGDFKNRLQTGIDEEERCFRQHNMRCDMLAPTGLCDLQSNLGESYLCDTCRQYPRYIAEFLDLREYSLSLSCPEAVRMMLDPAFHFDLTESEDDTFDDPEEFDDFDPFLFDKLTYARGKMLNLVKDHSRPLQERMELIADMAFQLQELYDLDEIFEMDKLSCDIDHGHPVFSCEYMLGSLDFLLGLEVLEKSWTDTLRATKAYWNGQPSDFDKWNHDMLSDMHHTFIFEKLLQALLFTYFYGSVYDGQIYARTMIAVMSVKWIMMISYANPELSLPEMVYLFSREVEHSDLNMNALISYFEDEL